MLYLQCISSFITNNLFGRSLELLNSEQNLRIVFNALEGSYALCLLANLIQLANIEREEVLREICFPSFTVSYFSIMKYIDILIFYILHESFTVCCDKDAGSVSTICSCKTKQFDTLASCIRLVRTNDRHFVTGCDPFGKITTCLSLDWQDRYTFNR